MSDCTDCHLSAGASTECAVCHEGRLPRGRVRDAVWVRIHGPAREQSHGQGNLKTCTVCHGTDDCAECHGEGVPHDARFVARHGEYAKAPGEQKCATCHSDSAFCTGCHRIEMPHPKGFLQKHSRVATSDADPKCTTCHPPEDCNQCHEYHVHPGGSRPPVGKYGVD